MSNLYFAHPRQKRALAVCLFPPKAGILHTLDMNFFAKGPIMKAIFLSSVALLIGSASAQAQTTCYDLWLQRNIIFKQAGYCFKTSQAVRAFGNAGCQYDKLEDVPLSDWMRDNLRGIQQQERIRGCSR
jgi:hypothetical protein